MNRLLWIVGLLAVWAVGLAQTASPSPKLKPGDVVTLVIVGMKEQSGDLAVLEDGSLNGPLFGRVVVQGLTVDEAKVQVTRALAKRLRDPQVILSLKSQRSSLVFVIFGEKSGPVPLVSGMTLRQLVATITMPNEPELLDAKLVRRSGETIRFDLLRLMQSDSPQSNLTLQPDDTVIILPKPTIRVWFVGTFARPGESRLREGIDVYQAIAQIGGAQIGDGAGSLVKAASAGTLADEVSLVVRRGTTTTRLPLRADPRSPGFILESGDVVFLDSPKQVRVVIAGEVRNPGEFIVRESTSLTSLIAQAKGVTEAGTLRNVIVFRGADALQIDATGPLSGDPAPKFQLQSDDVVFVSRNERVIYALGELAKPGVFPMPDERNLFATDALALAGGLSLKGTLRRVSLIRVGSDGKFMSQNFNLDEFLKDGKKEANPVLKAGDILLFGEPKGITLGNVSQIVSTALLLDRLVRGK